MTSIGRRGSLATLTVAVLWLAGCGSGGVAAPDPATGQPPGPGGSITVLAAASLTEAFSTIAEQFEAAHPGTDVTFSFGSSSTLATQVAQGAPADVFASASPAPMAAVTAQVTAPADFATNTLQIAVPRGNRAGVTGLADFAKADLRIALCAEQVPCGAAAGQVFAAAGIRPRPDTLESDVKAVLQKVTADEVDAALVYRTDVLAAGDQLEGIEFPEASAGVNRYPIAAVRASRNPVTAEAFVAYVLSGQGQRTLTDAGFGEV